MPITTLSSREFHQDTSRATKAAKKGPVYITNRGRRAYVLLSAEEYAKFTEMPRPSIADLLSCPAAAEIEFDPPRLNFIARPVDFD
jgi:prevent-host-death family protein